MSKSGRPNYFRGDRERRHQEKLERRIYVRTVRRPVPDVALLGKAFLALALADAARMAEEATSHDTGRDAEGGQPDEQQSGGAR